MAVSVETDPILRLETPKVLFLDRHANNNWDIHPDGKRFLMIKEKATIEKESTTDENRSAAPRPEMNMVMNLRFELITGSSEITDWLGFAAYSRIII